MTYKEFKKIMEKSGNLEIRNLGEEIVVAMKNDRMRPLCFIDNTKVNRAMEVFGTTLDMNSTEVSTFIEFVLTPVEER